MAYYCKSDYWEERYKKNLTVFEWYQNYDALKDLLHNYLEPTHEILNIGCGNSKMSEEMYNDGFTNISNVDNSYTIVKRMNDHYKDKIPLIF